MSITHVTAPAVLGLGVFVDDAKIVTDGATVSDTSFEADQGGWTGGRLIPHGGGSGDRGR